MFFEEVEIWRKQNSRISQQHENCRWYPLLAQIDVKEIGINSELRMDTWQLHYKKDRYRTKEIRPGCFSICQKKAGQITQKLL